MARPHPRVKIGYEFLDEIDTTGKRFQEGHDTLTTEIQELEMQHEKELTKLTTAIATVEFLQSDQLYGYWYDGFYVHFQSDLLHGSGTCSAVHENLRMRVDLQFNYQWSGVCIG